MLNSKISGVGYYVPERVVKNEELSSLMDTSDEWIVGRTGIKERRFAKKHEETTTTMGVIAAKRAIENAGITEKDVDFIVFATLSPDYYFPGCGVLLQRAMGMNGIGALDIRNQCSGFIYGLSIADQFVKTGMYKTVLVVGSEFHSSNLDFTTRGRGVSVIFGDGAGAAIVQATEEEGKGILTTHLHADGEYAEHLSYINPGCHGGVHIKDYEGLDADFGDEPEFGGMFISHEMIDKAQAYPHMNGKFVFKFAVEKFPEVIREALDATGYEVKDIDMLIPHQANLRISQMIQLSLGLDSDKVFNNIEKYGNTTAASIPIALCEAIEAGKVKEGDLVCLAAFGSGFTWGSALIRW